MILCAIVYAQYSQNKHKKESSEMLNEGTRKSNDEIIKRKTLMNGDLLKLQTKSVVIP